MKLVLEAGLIKSKIQICDFLSKPILPRFDGNILRDGGLVGLSVPSCLSLLRCLFAEFPAEIWGMVRVAHNFIVLLGRIFALIVSN